jgi:hypothetical protein
MIQKRYYLFLSLIIIIIIAMTMCKLDHDGSNSEGENPEINIKKDTINIPSGTGNYDFGSIIADGDGGTAGSDITFTIENLGTADLTVSSISITAGNMGDFDLTDNTSSPVAPSGSTTFTMRFDPLTTGSKSATVTISNNDSDEGTYTFTIIGIGVEWYGIQTVDAIGDVGSWTSIAVDDSNIYISYWDYTNDDLKFAKSTDFGITWPVENIKTVDSEGSVGAHSSIARNDNYIYISYLQTTGTPDALKFAKSSDWGSTWPSENIFTFNLIGEYEGWWTSLEVNSSNFYIIYGGKPNAIDPYCLKFVKSTDSGASWTTIPIDDSCSPAYNSLAIDEDNIYISYAESHKIVLAKSQDGGTTWQFLPVDTTGNNESDSSIVIESNNIYISYFDCTNGDLRFAKSTDGGATWQTLTIDAGVNTSGTRTSIAADENNIYISYWDKTNCDLKFAKSTDYGNTWNIKTIDSIGDVGGSSSIEVNGNYIFISYYDDTNGDLKFAKSIDGGLTW